MKYLVGLLLLFLPAQVWALTPTQAVTLALADADGQNDQDQPFLRYLYEPNPTADFVLALRLHVNLISREAAFAYPKLVARGLWRVDVRDYQWNRDTWEKLGDIDPYFHRQEVRVVEVTEEYPVRQAYGYTDHHGQKVITEYRDETRKRTRKKRVVRSFLYVPLGAGTLASLSLLTTSQAPIVRADWFLVQGARQTSLRNQDDTGVGYYDWLQLKSRDDYFRLVGFRQRDAQRVQAEYRAVVKKSGVSQQNRQIARFGAATGALWQTLDTFDESGRGIAIQNLRDDEFKHDVEEYFTPLPNGLQATAATSDQGVLQASVPDKIGGNRCDLNTSRDLRIHVNISCLQCHAGNVLQQFSDDVRGQYVGRLKSLTGVKDIDQELKRQYGSNINRVLQRDREDLQDALFRVTGGKQPQDAVALYSEAFKRYAEEEVTLERAAAEMGIAPARVVKALSDGAFRLGKGDFRFDPYLLVEPGTISRLTFEDAFQDLQDVVFGVLKE